MVRMLRLIDSGPRRSGGNQPLKTMITNLEQLYFNQIRDLYSAEIQLLGMFPQMAAHASNPELRSAFRECLADTHTHCARLGTISERHGISHETVACEAIKGMVLETKRDLTKTVPGDVRDAVLIASGNRIEHYEIAGYGMAKAFADCLGFDDDSMLLDATLLEEEIADAAMTKIAAGGLFHLEMNQPALLI
jgi:ferritin-like metal-binding protein YciE